MKPHNHNQIEFYVLSSWLDGTTTWTEVNLTEFLTVKK